MNKITDDILAQATGPQTDSIKPLANAVVTGFQPISSPSWVRQMSSISASQELLHPCVVDQQDTLVHASDLSQRNPSFFKRLESFARQQGFKLLADRRLSDETAVVGERRKPWVPAIILGLSMQSALVAAEPTIESHDHHNHFSAVSYTAHAEKGSEDVASHSANYSANYSANRSAAQDPDHQTRLALVVDQLDTNANASDVDHLRYQQLSPTPLALIDDLGSSFAEIEAILLSHYQSSANEPEYISADIADMARYFAQYPEAVRLIRSLQDQRWRLAYRQDSFETQVTGNQIQVKSVKVFFDSRSAAQLRKHKACSDKPGACIASPADALLHELLHVESALLNTEEFIAQGGLSKVIYPYQHERAVIKRENQLYKSMSHLDGGYRPHRSNHSGKLLASACVTCLD